MQKIISLLLSVITALTGVITGFFGIDKTPREILTEITKGEIEYIDENFGFINDLIILFAKEDASYKDIKNIAGEIGGRVVAYLPVLNRYQIKTEKKSFEELLKISENLIKKDEVIYASPDFSVKVTDKAVPDDPWTSETDMSFSWDCGFPRGSNWHLTAIDAPGAWEYSDRMGHIDIGIVDSGFEKNHEDLTGKIVFPSRYFERSCDISNHGTHVAGIIGANANNGTGITGICWNSTLHCVDWEPNDKQFWLDGERILTGLAATVMDGAKVVNFSCGLDAPKPGNSYPEFLMDLFAGLVSVYMGTLLKSGYDFIVCQAAGNGDEDGYAIDAVNCGFFCTVKEDNCLSNLAGVKKNEVLDRIIVVGNARNNYNNTYEQSISSNVGPQVDICAPGSYVYSLYTTEKGKYGYMSGTSMAAPVVTAVCGLVWSVDESFTGAEVAKIVCDENNTKYAVAPTPEEYRKYSDIDYRELRLVNAQLAVEAAIALSDAKK